MSGSDWGWLVLLSWLWGGTFLFVGVGVREFPPLTLVMLRVVIAAGILLVVARLRGVALPSSWTAWRPFVILAITNNVIPFTLIAWGQQHIASGLASVINAATPLFTLLVARGLVGEPIAGGKLAGVLLGLVGVGVLIGPDFGAQGWGVIPLGMAACLGAALSYGTAAFVARHVRSEPPLKIAAAQLTVSSIVMTMLAAAGDRFWLLPTPSLGAIGAVLALATLSTAWAYLVFFRIVTTAGPQNANLVTLLIPPSAIVLGTLVLGESLQPRHLVGATLIGLGLIVIDGRVLRRTTR